MSTVCTCKDYNKSAFERKIAARMPKDNVSAIFHALEEGQDLEKPVKRKLVKKNKSVGAATSNRPKVLSSAGAKASCAAEKTNTAFKTRKVMKSDNEILLQKFKKLEVETHTRFRLLEEKLSGRMEKLEKRTSAFESLIQQHRSTSMGLFKKTAEAHRVKIEAVESGIKSMQSGLKSTQQSFEEQLGKLGQKSSEGLEEMEKTVNQSKKNRVVNHNFEQRMAKVEAAITSVERDICVPSLRVELGNQEKKEEKEPAQNPQKKGVVHFDPEYENIRMHNASMAASAYYNNRHDPETMSKVEVGSLRGKIKEIDEKLKGITRCTSDSLSEMNQAILFLYKNSNILEKAKMSNDEINSVFGKIRINKGDDDLWC